MQVLLLRSLRGSCFVESDMENHAQATPSRARRCGDDSLPPAVREASTCARNARPGRKLGKSQAELGMADGSKLPAARRIGS